MDAARQILSVLLVFALLGTVLWLLRRGSGRSVRGLLRLPPGRTKLLEPVERLALTPQHSLHVVRVHGREFLVATHPQGCTVLAEPPPGAAGA